MSWGFAMLGGHHWTSNNLPLTLLFIGGGAGIVNPFVHALITLGGVHGTITTV
jgi:hypothetical protein